MRRSIPLFLFLFTLAMACSEEPGGPIIIDPGNGNGGGDPNNCNFSGIEQDYLSCVEDNSERTLDVVTWNLKTFPLNGSTSVSQVAEVIRNINADVIALQEISSQSRFNELVSLLDGWEADLLDISGGLELGFLFKSCEISDHTPAVQAVTDIWPRPVVKTVVTHTTGLEVVLLNIHLKCCDEAGDLEDRLEASQKIETYIENSHNSDGVIVLGDFNDDILNGSPFSNFIDDPANYLFVDTSIAEGPSSGWSYPSWPSHIDHLLITSELFDNYLSAHVLDIDQCIGGYFNNVSDHRPVMVKLEK